MAKMTATPGRSAMDRHRIEPTGPDDLKAIEKCLAAGDEVIVQFFQPKQYPAERLAWLDTMCKKHGARVLVRFYSGPFNGQTLRKLPSVAALLIDCMDYSEPANLKEIWSLAKLRCLHFGGYCIAEPEILHGPNLRQLEELGVGQSKR